MDPLIAGVAQPIQVVPPMGAIAAQPEGQIPGNIQEIED